MLFLVEILILRLFIYNQKQQPYNKKDSSILQDLARGQ